MKAKPETLTTETLKRCGLVFAFIAAFALPALGVDSVTVDRNGNVLPPKGGALNLRSDTKFDGVPMFTLFGGGGAGLGDVISGASSSVDSELTLFQGTSGKQIKRATGSGMIKLTNGVLSFGIAGTDYVAPATTVNGHALSANVTLDATDIGLGNVTNNTQTRAAIVPNTAPTTGQLLIGNSGGTAYGPQTISGTGATVSLSNAGVLSIGGIPNASLANSSISIAGSSTALGGSISRDTITGLSTIGLVKRTGVNTLAIAAPVTDYEGPIPAGTTSQYWRGDKTFQTLDAAAVGLGSVVSDIAGKQAAIQYKDEGTDLGTSGTVTSIDFVGAGVAATRSTNALTITIAGGGGGGGAVATDTIWDALGDIVYGSGADTGAKLAGNTTTTKKFLRQTGNGSISAAPAWDTVTASDAGLSSVTNDAQTKAAIVPNTAPSTGQLLVGNAGGTAYVPASLSGSGATASLSSAGVLTLSAIPNATLTNSAITIAGTSTALGTSITQDTITGLSTTGLVKRTGANALAITADNSSNWDTAFTDRLKWDGGATGLTAATGRTSLGATTAGANIFTLTNPSAISFLKIAADNTVAAESAATHRTSLGATTVGSNLFTLTNPSAITFLKVNADNTVTAESAATFKTSLGITGGGDASTNTSTSVDSEVALFSGTAGKTLKRATGTGIPKLTSGVQSISTTLSDHIGTVANRGYTNTIFMAFRADGIDGAGTPEDPRDVGKTGGQTNLDAANKFDAILTAAADGTDFVLVGNGDSGVFYTKGSHDGNADLTYEAQGIPRNSRLRGQGMYRTTLQIVQFPGAFWSRTVTDSVTNGTTTITSATAAFHTGDVGRTVTGTNIPGSTTISSVTNATTAVMSNAATGSGSSGTLTLAFPSASKGWSALVEKKYVTESLSGGVTIEDLSIDVNWQNFGQAAGADYAFSCFFITGSNNTARRVRGLNPYGNLSSSNECFAMDFSVRASTSGSNNWFFDCVLESPRGDYTDGFSIFGQSFTVRIRNSGAVNCRVYGNFTVAGLTSSWADNTVFQNCLVDGSERGYYTDTGDNIGFSLNGCSFYVGTRGIEAAVTLGLGTGAVDGMTDAVITANNIKVTNLLLRSVADFVTNGTTTVTSATAAFTSFDVGRTVSGTNIPTGAIINSINSATSVVISSAATGSGSAGTLNLLTTARHGMLISGPTSSPAVSFRRCTITGNTVFTGTQVDNHGAIETGGLHHGTSITNNAIYQSDIGVMLARSGDNQSVNDNDIYGCRYAFYFNNSTPMGANNSYVNNRIYSPSSGGWHLNNSSTTGLRIVNNLIYNTTNGITFAGSTGNIITGNLFESVTTPFNGEGTNTLVQNNHTDNGTPVGANLKPWTVTEGGTGTATPALVQGSGITITGTWPNNTIAAAGGGRLDSTPAAAVDLSINGTTPTTVSTASATLAAGDTIHYVLRGRVNNTSGGTKTYSGVINLGSKALTVAGSATVASGNNAPLFIEGYASVISTTALEMYIQGRMNPLAATDTSVTPVFQDAWTSSASNFTGSQTVSIQLKTSATSTASTQVVAVTAAFIEQIPAL